MHKLLSACFCALMIGLALGGNVARASDGAPVARVWTPETSIAMRYFPLNFAAPQHWPTPLDRPEGILFSPDRRHFLFVEYRGDVGDDSMVARVSIYASEVVRRGLRSRANRIAPLRQFEMRSRSSRKPAIASLRWDDDSAGLLFDGLDDFGAPHVYFFDVASGQMTSVASLAPASPDDSEPLFGYRNGASLLFTATVPRRPAPSYPGQWMDRRADGSPVLPDDLWRAVQSGPRRVSRREARCEGRSAPAPDVSTWVRSLAIAPRGCRAILIVQGASRGLDYRLLDIRTGVSRQIAAAIDARSSISWSPDGRWALLLNVKTGEGAAPSPVAMLSLETGALQVVEGAGPGAANPRIVPRWLSVDALIAPDSNSPTGVSRLELRDRRWARRPGADFPAQAPNDDGFDVRVRQSLNEPARVVVRAGRVERVLSEADPVLASVARREWREISFIAPDGRTQRAALMLPAVQPGRSAPPPLVVNPYHYENYGGSHNRLFLPDGQHEGAESAAQVLAARGFAVLWMDAWANENVAGAPTEGPEFVARLDAVLAELSRQHLIDPDRVGMAGYSRGGYLTLFSATHPGRMPIRTHVAIDNFLGSTEEAFFFKTYGAELPALDVFADRPGTLERDTMLNVDRVRGPVLFTLSQGNDGAVLWPLQVMHGAFMLARRPSEQLSFPVGVHNLQRPSERLMLMNAIVDWMAFWLMDETPPDPERARVWTQLRTQWQRQQAWEAAGNPVASAPPADFVPPPPPR